VEAEERPAGVGDGPSDEEGGVEKLVQIRIIHREGQKRVAEGLWREGELGDGGAGAEGEEGLASLPTGAAVVGWGEEGRAGESAISWFGQCNRIVTIIHHHWFQELLLSRERRRGEQPESNARMRDPVYGCVVAISYLQQQVSQLQVQLALAKAEILCVQMRHNDGNSSKQQQHQMDVRYPGLW
jgi:hypothetical protein